MAAPNIVNVSTITGKITGAALGTTLTTSLLANSASSGKVFKVNTILVSNVDGTNNVDITLDVYDGTINVPADSTLVLLEKSSFIYLEEGWSIRGGAGAASDAEVIISYEEIS